MYLTDMEERNPRQALLHFAELRGVSLAALSAFIGRNSSYLQQFVRKGSPRKLDEVDRRKLAEFLGVSESDLGGVTENSFSRSAQGRSQFVEIQRLAAQASAGAGAHVGDEAVIDRLRFSAQWLRSQGLDPAHLSAIAVAGDSMEPLLRDGDEILVDTAPRPLRDGVHVVMVGDTLLVKRVQTGIPGKVLLESANPAYRPLELAMTDLRVIGRVVWKGGRF